MILAGSFPLTARVTRWPNPSVFVEPPEEMLDLLVDFLESVFDACPCADKPFDFLFVVHEQQNHAVLFISSYFISTRQW